MISFDTIINLCCSGSTGNEAVTPWVPKSTIGGETNEVVVKAQKNTPSHKAGVRLVRSDDDNIVIGFIADSSIFQGTELTEGLQVLSINGVSTQGKSIREMSEVVAQAPKDVEIRAIGPRGKAVPESCDTDVIVVSVEKSKKQKAGIRLAKNDQGELFVDKILPNTIFSGTDLDEGMILLAVNSVSTVGKSVKEASLMIGEITGKLNMQVQKPSSVPLAIVEPVPVADEVKSPATQLPEGAFEVTVKKSKPSQKMGIHMVYKQKEGVFALASVSRNSPFAGHVEKGMIVLSVNGQSTENSTLKALSKLVSEAKEEVTLVVRPAGTAKAAAPAPKALETPSSAPEVREYRVTKADYDTKIGLKVKDEDGHIVIRGVTEDGLFAKSSVRPGLRVTQFQGQPTSHIKAADLSTMLGGSIGNIQIRMEAPPGTAVTLSQ